jgi:putative FmdB family regulatory protein
MPVYEYQCKACDHQFEREQRITDAPIKKCPKCGAAKARRLISRTSFVLKGGGWYSDLYGSAKPARSEAAEGSAGESKPAESKPEAKTEGKTDTKPTGGGKKGRKAAAA